MRSVLLAQAFPNLKEPKVYGLSRMNMHIAGPRLIVEPAGMVAWWHGGMDGMGLGLSQNPLVGVSAFPNLQISQLLTYSVLPTYSLTHLYTLPYA